MCTATGRNTPGHRSIGRTRFLNGTTSMSKIDIHKKYEPLWSAPDEVRFFVVTGGRGSGKSFAVSLNLNTSTYEEGHTILFTRYTLTSANISIIPEFLEKIEMMGKTADFRITKDEIINLTTNSNIIFRGIKTASGNQTAALKSITGLTTWVLDEAEELLDEATFNKIERSVRKRDKRNRIIIVMNPCTKDHWIYKRFFDDMKVESGWNGTRGNVCYIHTTFEDNMENLSEDFIQEVMNTKLRRPDVYEHEILGGWKEKADGVVFTNWRVGKFRELERMCYGQDFGFSDDPTTLVQVSLDLPGRKLYVREVYGKSGMTTQQIAAHNLRYAGHSLIIGDSSEPRLISELRSAGVNIHSVKKKHGSILSGITMMQDMEIIVDPDSKEIIKELNNYVWHDNGDRPVDKNNHYLDSIRYALTRLYVKKSFGRYALR